MMKRAISLAVVLILLAGSAFGWPLARTWKGGLPWWNNGDLTFYAPFTDPSDPLRLIKGTGTLSLTRATTATYVYPTTGLVTTAASGQLRIESNGALIEGQRTNLALQSEALGNATNWVASNVTVDNNTAVAPDGATTAETLTATADNATLLQAYTGTVAAYTGSYYLKRKTGTGAVQVSADNTTWTSCTINASTWTRCSDTRTVTVATYYHGVRLATSGDAVYAWGGDAELGAFASSYIKTEAAAATRNADLLTMLVSGNVSDTAGTLSLNFDLEAVPAISTTFQFIRGAAAYSGLYVDANNFYTNDGIDRSNISATINPILLAFRWQNDMKIAINGTISTTGSVGYDGSWIGATSTINLYDTYAFFHIKNLRIWNRAFTDSELQAITQ